MAQPDTELLDSVNPSAETPADTDELLSQLAGNEIDRLLAEADAEQSSKLVKPIPAEKINLTSAKSEAAPVQANENISEQLEGLFEKIEEETSANGNKDKAAPTDTVDAELAARQTESAPHGQEREAMLAAAGFENPSDAPAPSQAEGSEREALLTAAGFDTSASEIEPGDFTNEFDDAEDMPEYIAPLPFYLKPLEWINAPLEACSPNVRELLGKFAIVTLVNAIAAIGFVLLFKKH